MSTSSRSRYSEKFIPKLLDRLGKAKAKAVANLEGDDVLGRQVRSNITKIGDELERMKHLVPRVELWEQNLQNQFTGIERGLEKIIAGVEKDVDGAFERIAENVKKIKDSAAVMKSMPPLKVSAPESSMTRTSQLRQTARYPSQQWLELDLVSDVYDRSAGHLDSIRRSYERLDSTQMKMCFLSLSIFPEDSVIKKRPLIYWWIGEGFITSTQDKTAEEVGEEIFEKLLRKDLIIQPTVSNFSAAVVNSTQDETDEEVEEEIFEKLFRPKDLIIQPTESSSPTAVVNSCKIHHWIRHMLIFVAEEASLFKFNRIWPRMPCSGSSSECSRACLTFGNKPGAPDDHWWTVFNVDEQYLDLKPEWLTKLNKVAVLQLGRWQGSPTHHIEVEDEGFLKGLNCHQNKHLKFLSLRGISQITQLPPCIFNITSLEILDLRACHTLETLPEDISPLRKLTHLDLSECYLLDRMPEGIDKLSHLQVLKGYVIGYVKRTPCSIGDFAKLNKLRRLSIHIANEAEVLPGEFKEFKKIESLRRLKISWGVVSPEIKTQSLEFSFPPHLEKLALQGIPLVNVSKWLNPRQLKNLKKLYVIGGKLGGLDHEETECKWTVEVLRLKYLYEIANLSEVVMKQQFPSLLYLETFQCKNTIDQACQLSR